MPGPNSQTRFVDGTLDFSGGVNSLKVRTVQSERTPNGLGRNELAWLINGDTRNGGLSPRAGWQPRAVVHDGSARYQGGFVYEPVTEHPYLILSIGGHIYRVRIDPEIVITDLSDQFGLFNPPDGEYAFFAQAEEFLIIQAGDGVTLPLFWDGATLRRSAGITDPNIATNTPGVNEIPAAGPMHYYMGRLWYAHGLHYSAGDIIGGVSGTAPYGFRDSILNVTENPLSFGGDGFGLPSRSSTIRALHSAPEPDTSTGQGRLFIFTRDKIFALQVPVSRSAWIAADTDNRPLQTVVGFANGSVNDRSIVEVNNDLWFRSLEPGIRSLRVATRSVEQWANVDLSANVRRLLQYEDRSLLRFASGIVFNNRLLMTALPLESAQGVVFHEIVPLDFMPISTVGEQRPPAWQGMYEGLDHFQLFKADFGGRERAFTICLSKVSGNMQLWELTYADRREFGDGRVTVIAEFPAFSGFREDQFKELVGGELWIDRLWGTVFFKVEYRPDGENCWLPWHEFSLCSPRNKEESGESEASGYPGDLTDEYGQGYRQPVALPKPEAVCQDQVGRPSTLGYQFQMRLTMRGNCRVRGLLLHLTPREQAAYPNLAPCEFTEFPVSTVEVWHEFEQTLAGEAPTATITLAEPEPEPEDEEEDMPLHHAIYVAEKDAIFGVHGGLLYKFDADTGDMVLRRRLIQPDWGPTWLTYVPGEDRLLSTYWQPSQFINARRGFFILNPETLEEISFVNYLDIFGVAYTSYHNGPFQTMWQNDELFAVTGRSGTTSRWTRFLEFFTDVEEIQDVGTSAFYAQGEMAFNPEGIIADADVGARTGPTFATVPLFNAADEPTGVHFEIYGEYEIGVNVNYFSIYSTELSEVPTSICYAGAQRYYMATKSGILVKAVDAGWTGGDFGGLDVTISYIDMELAVAPMRIRFNPHNGKIYLPDLATNQVIIFDPATDTVESVKTGFTDPLDVVFTPTKAFAVQQSGKALKEIV